MVRLGLKEDESCQKRMSSVFTFLPHSDLAEEQGQIRLGQIRLGKGNVTCSAVAYMSFNGSNHWELPSLRKLLSDHTALFWEWPFLPGKSGGQNMVVPDQWKSH